METPKDIGLKFGSKEEAAWNNIAISTEEQILAGEISMEINKNVLEFAKKRLKEEHEKYEKGLNKQPPYFSFCYFRNLRNIDTSYKW